jgi:hypothetical protein
MSTPKRTKKQIKRNPRQNWGGARPGAGRPVSAESSRVVRLPESTINKLDRLDALLDCEANTIDLTEVTLHFVRLRDKETGKVRSGKVVFIEDLEWLGFKVELPEQEI